MADNEGIGTRVSVLGDKEYKSALRDIGRQLTVLNTGMKATDTAFKGNEDSIEALTEKHKNLQDVYDVHAKKVQLIAEQLNKAKAEYTENSVQADELQIALNRAQAAMSSVGNDIKSNDKALQALADATEEAARAQDGASGKIELAKQALKQSAGECAAYDQQLREVERSMERGANKSTTLAEKQELLDKKFAAQGKACDQLQAAYNASVKESGEFSEQSVELAKKLQDQKDALYKTQGEITKNAEAMKGGGKAAEDMQARTDALKQTLKQSASECNAYDQQLREVERSMGNGADKSKALAEKQELLQKKFDAQGKACDQLQAAYNASVKESGEFSEESVELAKKLQDQKDALDKTQGAMAKNEEAMKGGGKAADDMKDSVDDAAKGVEDEGKAAGDAEGENTRLKDAMAAAGGVAAGALKAGLAAAATAFAAVAAAAGAAVTKGFEFAKGAGTYADDLLTLSTQTSVSAQSLQGWSYAARFIDTDVSTMTGSMSKMIKQMGEADKGSKTAADKFKALGVSVYDSNGHMRSSEEVFADCIDALGKVGNETERDALAMDIFGKSAQELNPLIEAGGDALKDLCQEAENMGTVFGDDALSAMGSFDDSMQRAQATGNALKTAIGLTLIPAFQPLVDKASTSMAAVATALSDGLQPGELDTLIADIMDTLGGALEDVTGIVEAAVPVATSAIGSIVGALVDKLPGLVSVLLPAALGLMQSVVDGISKNAPQLAALAVNVLTSVVGFVAQNAGALMEAATAILTGLVDGIIEALPELIPAAVQMMVSLAVGLVKGIPRLVAKLPEIITAIWNGLKNVNWAELGGELLAGLMDGLGSLGDGLAGLFGDGLSGITGLDWGDIGTTITGALGGIGSWFGGLFDKGKDKAEGLSWSDIGTAAKEGVGTVLDVGGTFLSGLFEAGKTAIGNINWASVGEGIQTAVNGVLDVGGAFLAGGFEAGKAAIERIDWVALGTTIGDAFNGIVDVAGDFLAGGFEAAKSTIETIDWAALGTTIGDAFNGLVDTAGDFLAGGFEAAKSTIETIDWAALGTTIGDAFNGLVDTAGDFLAGGFEAAETAINDIDWAGIGTTIGNGLNSGLTVINSIVSGLEGIGTGFGTLLGGVGEAIGGAGEWLADIWKTDENTEAKDAGATYGQSVADGVASKEEVVKAAAKAAGEQLLAGITEALGIAEGGASSKGKDAGESVAKGINDGLNAVTTDSFKTGATAIASAVAEAVGAAFGVEGTGLFGWGEASAKKFEDIGKAVCKAIADGITANSENTDAVKTAITGVADAAYQAAVLEMSTGLTGGTETVNAAVDAVATAALAAATALLTDTAGEEIGETFVAGIEDGVDSAGRALTTASRRTATAARDAAKAQLTSQHGRVIGADFGAGLRGGIESQRGSVANAASGLGGAAVSALWAAVGHGGSRFREIGDAICEGMARGIRMGTSKITSAARDAAREAYEAARDELGIRSPSRRMAEVGQHYDEGFAQGIMGGMGKVLAGVRALTSMAADEAAYNGGAFGMGGSAGGGMTIDYDRLGDAVADSFVRRGLGSTVLAVDGKELGRSVEPGVSVQTYRRSGQSVTGRAARLVVR